METQLHANVNKILGIIIILVPVTLWGQPECKTSIGAHLKPIAESPFTWALEGSMAHGLMTERQFTNLMAIGGFGLSGKNLKHQFYNETAYKYWWNSNPGAIEGLEGNGEHFSQFPKTEKKHLGLREMFYQYKVSNTQIKTGLQSNSSPDYFLVDERILGASLNQKAGAFTFHATLGTTHRDYSRMQNICGTRHLYRLIRENRSDFTGKRLFESNLFYTAINYEPGKKSKNTSQNAGLDEFEEFSEFTSETKNSPLIENIGMIYYQEFGDVFHDYKHYAGIYTKLNLPLNIALKLETVYQYISTEKNYIVYAGLSKDITLNKSVFKGHAGYFYKGKSDVPFYPSFSNMFVGEIIRLDSKEMPLITGAIKYQHSSKMKPFVRLLGVKQIHGNLSNEIDLETGAHLYRGLRLYATCSRVQSGALDKIYYMGKLEIRFTF